MESLKVLVWKHCSGIAKMFFLATIQIYFIMTKHYNIIYQKKHFSNFRMKYFDIIGMKRESFK